MNTLSYFIRSGNPRMAIFILLNAIVFVAVSFFSLSSCTDHKIYYVQANILTLRGEPRENAPVTGVLRINTQVSILEKKKDWAKVGMPGLSGWVLKTQIAKKTIEREVALSRIQSLSGPQKIEWLERIVAVVGTRKEDWAALLSAYQESGLAEKAARIRALLDGRAPFYIAACSGDKALLIGEYSPASGLRPIPEIEALEQLRDELSVASWYPPGGPALPGMPFPSPRVGGPTLPEGESFLLELGECPSGTVVLATAPIRSAAVDMNESADTYRLIREALEKNEIVHSKDSLEVLHLLDPPSVYEVRFTDAHRPSQPYLSWTLLDDKYQPLKYCIVIDRPKTVILQVPACKDEPDVTCSALIEESRWFKPSFVPGIRIGFVRWNYGGAQEVRDESGAIIDTHSSNKEEMMLVLVKESGCIDDLPVATASSGD